jgi:hypothetical protein
MFETFAPRWISRVTWEFWGRPRQSGRFYFGGLLFWLFLGVAWLLGRALKFVVYLLIVVGICFAQLVGWGADAALYWPRKLSESRSIPPHQPDSMSR